MRFSLPFGRQSKGKHSLGAAVTGSRRRRCG
jgi:hypothetical protein